MRFFQDESDLSMRFKSMADVSLFGLPIDWPSSKTDPALSGGYQGMFCRFRVSRLGDSRLIATQGTIKHYRNYGSVLMQVIGPIGSGPDRVLKAVDVMSSFFISWRQGGMLCKTPSAGPIVESKSDFSVTVSVPFTSDFRVDTNTRQIVP